MKISKFITLHNWDLQESEEYLAILNQFEVERHETSHLREVVEMLRNEIVAMKKDAEKAAREVFLY